VFICLYETRAHGSQSRGYNAATNMHDQLTQFPPKTATPSKL